MLRAEFLCGITLSSVRHPRMPKPLSRLLGAKLLNQSKELVSTDSVLPVGKPVEGTKSPKYVMVFFSAEWCPACRNFLKPLKEFYTNHKETKNFEIVFVSRDNTREEFRDYFHTHHGGWLAVPYENTARLRARLVKRFKLSGIPAVVVLNVEDGGTLVTRMGRQQVLRDLNEAVYFPWKPRDVGDIIRDIPIMNKADKRVDIAGGEKADGTISKSGLRYVALYFASKASSASRVFTPLLKQLYPLVKGAHGDAADFVYVSNDATEADYKINSDSMPWTRVPFQHEGISALVELFNITSIPTLVTADLLTGEILNMNAKDLAAGETDLIDDSEAAITKTAFPWMRETLPPVAPLVLSPAVLEAIQTNHCIMLATNNAPNIDVLVAELQSAAAQIQESHVEIRKSIADVKASQMAKLTGTKDVQENTESKAKDEGASDSDDVEEEEDSDSDMADETTTRSESAEPQMVRTMKKAKCLVQFFIADHRNTDSLDLQKRITSVLREEFPVSGAVIFGFDLKHNKKYGILQKITAGEIVAYTKQFLLSILDK